jgi:hypothetical protein
MNARRFRKIFLLSGIFLLSTFMLVKLSWGCDDHDKSGCDHHDKGACDHRDKRGCDHPHHQCNPPLVIQSVDVDLENNKILIHGENFDNGPDLVVTLGGIEIQQPKLNSPKEIEAILPSLQDSDYRLVVSTGHGRKCKDKYSLTIGAPGPAGPTGRIVTVIVSNKVQDLTYLPDDGKGNASVWATASCEDAGPGYTVIGGGFEVSENAAVITKSMPSTDGKGWYVFGYYSMISLNATEKLPVLTTYAICARIIQ